MLARYVSREFLFAFLVSFLFFFVIFFINVLLVMADDILSKQVPLLDVASLITFSLPQIIAYAFPFGTLLGSLMALGRLTSDLELLALQAAGVRLMRVFWPLAALGVLFSGVSFVTNDLLLPASTIEFNRVYRRILYSNPALELEANSVKRFEDTSIVTGPLRDNVLHDVTIIDKANAEDKRVITARTAELSASGLQAGVISLRLTDVFSQVVDADDPGRFEYVRSDVMEYNIILEDISISLASLGPREKSSVDVWREIDGLREDYAERQRQQGERAAAAAHTLLLDIGTLAAEVAAVAGVRRERLIETERRRLRTEQQSIARELRRPPSDRSLRNHLFEFHKKFSIPFACLVFMVFAFPAGLLAPRSGRSYGFVVGIAVAVLYWALLVFGQTGGLRFRYSPAVAMWLPNVAVLALAGGFLALRRAR